MNKCDEFYIYRKPYKRTTKTGKTVKVKGACIKSRSITGRKASEIDKSIIKNKKLREKRAEKMTKSEKLECPKGMIKRAGYIRKSHERHSRDGKVISVQKKILPAICIKSRGIGSTVRIPVMTHELGKFGYHDVVNMSVRMRHSSLNDVVNTMGYLPVIKKLNALATLNKNTNPAVSKVFKDDQEWLSKKYRESGKVNSVIYKPDIKMF